LHTIINLGVQDAAHHDRVQDAVDAMDRTLTWFRGKTNRETLAAEAGYEGSIRAPILPNATRWGSLCTAQLLPFLEDLDMYILLVVKYGAPARLGRSV
jgi:hypothetical protein